MGNRFQYHALDEQEQAVTGEIAAATVQQAVEQLESRGWVLQSIALVEPAATADVTEDAETDALQAQWQRALKHGQPMLPALRAFVEEFSSRRDLRHLNNMIDVIERQDAKAAHEAMLLQPGYWIPLFSALAQSSDPESVLHQFLAVSRRTEDSWWQWWLAWAYPLATLGLGLLFAVAFAFWIVPDYYAIYRSFNMDVPLSTLVVFHVSHAITSGLLLMIAMALLATGGVLWTLSWLLPVQWRDAWGNRFGLPTRRLVAQSQLSRYVADLLEADLTVPLAIKAASAAVYVPRLRRAADKLAQQLSASEPVSINEYWRPLSASLVHALQAEMPAAARIGLLRELTVCRADQVRQRRLRTHFIMGPLAIGFVGLVVIVTVLGLFLPLVSPIGLLT
jgi:type II secretory pathway component PulF